MNLPKQYQENMRLLLKDDYDKYINTLNREKFNAIRINNLKITDDEFFKLIGKTLKKVPWSTSGYYIDNKEEFSKSMYYNAGLYYIQEPSAMSVSSLIPIEENDFVLDLCSAPGGKATAICDRLNGSGFLVANDISPSRCKALIKNIEMMGITNCCVTSDNHKKLAETFNNFFDKIILDVPCSGEGMFKSDNTAINNWNEHTNAEFKSIQLDILETAKNMLKENGIIAYSTCTFSVCENEEVIDEFLTNNSDFTVIPINNENYGFSNGLLDSPKNIGTNKSTRILPHLVDGEGHFLCLLQNTGNTNSKPEKSKATIDSNKRLNEMIKIYKDFEKKYIKTSFSGKFVSHENSLFLVHKDFIDLGKLRTMRSGFHLGDIKNNKFKPSQNLAFALNAQTFSNCITLSRDSQNLLKYTKGETIMEQCNDGSVLVCCNSYSVGFGIATNGKIKNKIGKSMIL